MKKPALLFTGLVMTMLVLALAPMPYGYYLLLRVVACTYFVYMALSLQAVKTGNTVFIAWTLAAIYNPFLTVNLNREMWSIINVISAVVSFNLAKKL